MNRQCLSKATLRLFIIPLGSPAVWFHQGLRFDSIDQSQLSPTPKIAIHSHTLKVFTMLPKNNSNLSEVI